MRMLLNTIAVIVFVLSSIYALYQDKLVEGLLMLILAKLIAMEEI